MNNLETLNELELRNFKVITPKTEKELLEIIHSLTERKQNYGACVYSVSIASCATFLYMANQLGITGFQASCADLDVLRRVRRIEGPFAIIEGRNMLYPQYNILEKVAEYLREWSGWASKEAKKLLRETHDIPPHPDVLKHWKVLSKKRGANKKIWRKTK